MASASIGTPLFSAMPLHEDEKVLRSTLAQYVRSPVSSWPGRLYLTNQRIVWTPLLTSFWCKPLSLEKSESVTAVTSTSIIERLGGFWEITASGSRHLFAPIPYRLLSHKGTQQWVDSINQWANS